MKWALFALAFLVRSPATIDGPQIGLLLPNVCRIDLR